MMLRMALMTMLVGGVAWAAEEQAKPPGAAAEREGVMDPKAEAALRRMSDYLAGLKTFQVDTTTVDEKITTDGQKIQEVQESKVLVKRPGELRVERVSPRGRALFVYDGKQFGLYNKDKNVFAIAAAPPTLDAAVDAARERLQIDAPLGDLIVPDAYGALTEGLQEGRYVGLVPIGGVMAHQIAVTKDNTDYQIWIKDGPDPVPLRMVIVSKDMRGQPEFTADLRNWQPNAPAPDNAFAFTPPAGAKRVEPRAHKEGKTNPAKENQ
jgi:hypothetical protein